MGSTGDARGAAPRPGRETRGYQGSIAGIGRGGTTTLSAHFIHHSLQHYLEQLHALIELHRDTFGADAPTR
ncbi:hypothetical protein BST14_17335 [Mycobacterium arosiense ATCC BAA-1401 = DSM 45069]|uniref:Uncharacterized protein n=1 Tax=Mycobacterium arosiense ATCC BAA-1401 = DSM 45069 TaxID=1265311 RepID=A0A1W9ZCV7_MYCAI|nr:hypothetical protein BST14_17335 [Mycobacterium arosiense ATCC BAA-1401 = DSM 45069]